MVMQYIECSLIYEVPLEMGFNLMEMGRRIFTWDDVVIQYIEHLLIYEVFLEKGLKITTISIDVGVQYIQYYQENLGLPG